MKALATIISSALLFALPTLGLAHTELASSIPKGGSVLTQSPPVIEIEFKSAAKLTSVVALGADKHERKLEFANGDKPNTFKISKPNLESGRNEIKWKALSHDGHVASGELVYTIKSAAKEK